MSVIDPISDMLTCIRNAQIVKKKSIIIYFSNIKMKILQILNNEGYIKKILLIKDLNKKKKIKIYLKYFMNKSVIKKIKRISKPGLRIYKKNKFIPNVMSGLGIIIISTSLGIMTDKKAKLLGVGGEIICYIS